MNKPREVVFVLSADGLVRAAVEQAMAAARIHTIMFESAADFLACERPDAPACLILDVVLSDMSGLDFQQQRNARDISVVFVTQQAQIATSVRAMKAGAQDFLTMPLPHEALLKAVRTALDQDVSRRDHWQQSRQLRRRWETLSSREREVLGMTLEGLACKQMAAALGISECTAQTHRRRLMRKMQVNSIPELMRRAQGLGVARVSNRPIRSATEHATLHASGGSEGRLRQEVRITPPY